MFKPLAAIVAAAALLSFGADAALADSTVTISSDPTANGTLMSGTFAPTGDDAVLNISDLEHALAAGPVTVTATGAGTEWGDIVVNAPISAHNGDLTLVAGAGANLFLNTAVDLHSLDASAPAGIMTSAPTIATTGNQTYENAVTLLGDLSLTATTGTVAFMDDVAAPSNPLTVDAPKAIVGGDVTGAGDPVALTLPDVELHGSITLTGAGATTIGDIDLRDNSTIGSTGSLELGRVEGAHQLQLTSDGATTVHGPVGATTPLTAFGAGGAGTLTLAGGRVSTSGSQTYSLPTTLAADTTIGGGLIVVTDSLDGAHALDADVTGLWVMGTIGATTPLASLTTAAAVQLYGGAHTIGGGTLSGSVDGTGSLTKVGSGTLELSGTTAFSGALNVTGGTLAITGDVASAHAVLDGGTLTGDGSLGTITAAAGGTLRGRLTVAHGVTLNAASTLALALDGPSDHDVLTAGDLTLGGAHLTPSWGYVPDKDTPVELVDNTGGNVVGAAFNGFPEGTPVTVGGRGNAVSYTGGDGNDLTLTPSAVPVTMTVTGNAVSDAGAALTLTASAPATAFGTPTGTVEFQIDGVTVATAPLAAGTATVTTSGPTVGAHQITAVYAGDSIFSAADSAPLAHTVQAPPPPDPTPVPPVAPVVAPPTAAAPAITDATGAGSCVLPSGRLPRSAARDIRFTYAISDAVKVTASVERVRKDAAARTTCPAGGTTARGGTPAGDYIAAKRALTRTTRATAGTNRLRLSDIVGKTKLIPGAYRLLLHADGATSDVAVRFVVLKRR